MGIVVVVLFCLLLSENKIELNCFGIDIFNAAHLAPLHSGSPALQSLQGW